MSSEAGRNDAGSNDAGGDEARARRVGALLVVVSATLWSMGGVGVKVAVAEPMVIAGLRSAFALAFMAIVLAVTLRRSRSASVVGFLLRRSLVWMAAFSYATMVVTFVLAARRTTAANAIFLQYTGPVYVALLSGPLLGERIGTREIGVVVACVAGMALAFGGELGQGRAIGNLLAIVSSFGFAGLPLLLRLDQARLEREASATRRGAVDGSFAARAAAFAPLLAMVVGNALAFVVAVPAIVEHPIEGPLAPRTWCVLVALGVLQIGVPYVLYAISVRRLRALESSLLATIEPVLSPLWVLLATGERPSSTALAGGALIVGAVAIQAVVRPARASTDAA